MGIRNMHLSYWTWFHLTSKTETALEEENRPPGVNVPPAGNAQNRWFAIICKQVHWVFSVMVYKKRCWIVEPRLMGAGAIDPRVISGITST